MIKYRYIYYLTYFTTFTQCIDFPSLDFTHDSQRKSWVESANIQDCDFPVQNLPFGVFKKRVGTSSPRIGVAIGNYIFDLYEAVQTGLFDKLGSEVCKSLSQASLNQFMELGRKKWIQTRHTISWLLDIQCPILRDNLKLSRSLLLSMDDVEMLPPVMIGDYTDFYASKYHALHVGLLLRPTAPLMPNYIHMPIGYHGRASSIVVSGTPIKRPQGQILDYNKNILSFTKKLDYEVELGFLIGPGSNLGTSIPMQQTFDHIFGVVIVNDWSARDIQQWEYQPLGPFNGKNFATTISSWIITFDALLPFFVDHTTRDAEDFSLLDHLQDINNKGLNICVESYIVSQDMCSLNFNPFLLSRCNFACMYWTIFQMLAHHTIGGCNMKTGDLLASGTISGSTKDSLGCLLEHIAVKDSPIVLPTGEKRSFLEDGDEIIIRAFATTAGFNRIGFGECRGRIVGSVA